jgi:pimeloyl-ACP methyl ester carboxylesterase
MPTFDRAGARIFYESHGTGPALLLTHGFSATSSMWSPQIEPLSRDHTVVVWDIRGHGRTTAPDEGGSFTAEATLADMTMVLDVCGIDRAVVGGLSLGGYLSLAFRLLHPDRVSGLIIADSGPGFRKDEARAQWNDDSERIATSIERNGAAERTAAMGVDPGAHRSMSGLANAARGILPQRDSGVIDSLSSIDVPTLLLVGADDAPFLTSAEYMERRIPGASLVVIPNAAHAANVDQPEAFTAAVADFLSSAGL